MTPSQLLREARLRAGLTQRELAERADTSQSVVARIETGNTSPTWDTLTRLIEAAGFTLLARLDASIVIDSRMLHEVARILALSPENRLRELENFSRFLIEVHRD